MSKTTIALIVAGIALVGAAGYLLFGQQSLEGAISTNTAATRAELTFLGLSERIDPVSFNSSITQDPRFMALQDIGIAIVDENAGRVDPFAPL